MRLTLNRPEVRNNLPSEVVPTPSRFAVIHSRLQITVHEFIRVQLGRVAREKEDLDLFPMLCQPSLDGFAVMHSQVIEDQKYFSSSILDEALHESNQNFTRHIFPIHHESHGALVGHGRDQS